jgi:hypothetical protein
LIFRAGRRPGGRRRHEEELRTRITNSYGSCCAGGTVPACALERGEAGGAPSNAVPFKENATADELRAEVMRHIALLSDAGVLDLEALLASKRRIAN